MSLTRIDGPKLDELVRAARAHPRRRLNLNLHRMEEPVHRLLNAIEPESYVAPHRHRSPPRGETLLVVRGRGAVVTFGDDGRVAGHAVLAPGGPTSIVELAAGTWHTVLALEPGTVWFEAKEGPYVPVAPEDLAAFAPAAGSPEVPAWMERMRKLVGTRS